MTRAIAKQLQLRILYRDSWHCTYCKTPLFFSPTLKLLEGVSPGHGYYDQHGKRGAMLSELENSCACCDHVEPYRTGGPTTEENLAASCFRCNRAKSDGDVPTIEPWPDEPRAPNWDGLASLYPALPGA
ncbi:unnamed protein product, partial [Ectocarpus fasciculatus]